MAWRARIPCQAGILRTADVSDKSAGVNGLSRLYMVVLKNGSAIKTWRLYMVVKHGSIDSAGYNGSKKTMVVRNCKEWWLYMVVDSGSEKNGSINRDNGSKQMVV